MTPLDLVDELDDLSTRMRIVAFQIEKIYGDDNPNADQLFKTSLIVREWGLGIKEEFEDDNS